MFRNLFRKKEVVPAVKENLFKKFYHKNDLEAWKAATIDLMAIYFYWLPEDERNDLIIDVLSEASGKPQSHFVGKLFSDIAKDFNERDLKEICAIIKEDMKVTIH